MTTTSASEMQPYESMDCVQPCCPFFRASLLAAAVLKTWFLSPVQSIRPGKTHYAAHLSFSPPSCHLYFIC